MNIFGVHLDRKATLPNAEQAQQEIKNVGCDAVFFNMNAADEAKRKDALGSMKERAGDKGVRLLLHSLAFGSLKPLVADDPKETVTKAQMDMTVDVMAHSLV